MSWFKRLFTKREHAQELSDSTLYNEGTFYKHFIEDLLTAEEEVIIESPFITSTRMQKLYPVLRNLIGRGVKVIVVTRDPREHAELYKEQSEYEIQRFEELGVQVLLCLGNHHRKLAILDRKILWEGSLNLLSQTKSREIMRRIEGTEHSLQMLNFINIGRFI